jgi:hypothetical protein
MEMVIPPDKRTGAARLLAYDEHGYQLVVDGLVTMSRRLEAICYVFSAVDRERISLIHGLQDAGEFRLARIIAAQGHHPTTP